ALAGIQFTHKIGDSEEGIRTDNWKGVKTWNTLSSDGRTVETQINENFIMDSTNSTSRLGISALNWLKDSSTLKYYTDKTEKYDRIYDTSGNNLKEEKMDYYGFAKEYTGDRYKPIASKDGLMDMNYFEKSYTQITNHSNFNALGAAGQLIERYQTADGEWTHGMITETTYERGVEKSKTSATLLYKDSDFVITSVSVNNNIDINENQEVLEYTNIEFTHKEEGPPIQIMLFNPFISPVLGSYVVI
ncbi:hypothetical protein BVX93_02320, partial [bacterium B13(2017)]